MTRPYFAACRAILPALLWFALPAPAQAGAMEDGVIAALNLARTQPARFADRLRAFRRQFRRDGSYVVPGDPAFHITGEGVAAVDEAIRFLERQRPVPPLQSSALLARAAQDHSEEQGPGGRLGHDSRGGGGPGDRVRKRGGGPYVAETIYYGASDAMDVAVQLIVDDGVASRGHRTIIFDPQWLYAGAGCGPHRIYRTMCTIDFAVNATGRIRDRAQGAGAGVGLSAAASAARSSRSTLPLQILARSASL